MNLTLQKKLAEIVMTSGNAQSQVTAIKALDALGEEMDDSIFNPWIDGKGDIKSASNEPEDTTPIFSSTPVQEAKKEELLAQFNIPSKELD